MSVEITSTPLIVLSKSPYRESSLIVVGISPDYGKLQLVCNGAQKISGKEYVQVDLFRELSVEFTESRSALKTAREIEIISTNDKLPENPVNFRLAGKMGAFLLANIKDDLPMPYTYDSFSSVLSHLSCSTPAGLRRRNAGPPCSAPWCSKQPSSVKTDFCPRAPTKGVRRFWKMWWRQVSTTALCPNVLPNTGQSSTTGWERSWMSME